MPDNKTKEYDETIVSACPHCFSSTHTIIDENKIGDFCGKCGKDKSIEDNKTILEHFDIFKVFDEIEELIGDDIPEKRALLNLIIIKALKEKEETVKADIIKKIEEEKDRYQIIMEKADTVIMEEKYSEEFTEEVARDMADRNASKVNALKDIINKIKS